MTVVTRLTAVLAADSDPFLKELNKAKKAAYKQGRAIREGLNVGAKAGFVAATAGAAAITAIYANAAQNADRLAKFSDQVGISTAKIAAYRHQAELSGVSQQKFDSSLERMVKRMGEAQNGTGAAAKELERMGLATDAFFALSPSEQFDTLSDKINELGTQQEKSATAAAIFGREGVSMLNMMRDGSAGIDAAARETERLGVALDRVDTAKFEAANDAMFRGKQAVTGLGNEISLALTPYVSSIATSFTDAAVEAGGFGTYVASAMDGAISAVAYGANAVKGLEFAWVAVKYAAAESIATSVELLAEADKSITSLLNRIPGVKAQQSEFISGMALSLRDVATEALASMDQVAAEGLPHDAIVKWAADAQTAINEAAEQVAANRAAITGGADSRLQGLQENADAEVDIERNKINAQLALANYQQNQLKKLQKQKKKELTDLEKYQKLSYKNQTKQVMGELASLTQGVAQHSKGMFRINQMAGIANATINTYEGVSKSLSAYPMPLAGIMAAAHLASGLSQIAAIKSASFSGGGGVAPSNIASGGAPIGGLTSNPTTGESLIPVGDASDKEEQSSNVTFVFNGPVSQDSAEWVADMLKEAVDRDYIMIDNVA